MMDKLAYILLALTLIYIAIYFKQSLKQRFRKSVKTFDKKINTDQPIRGNTLPKLVSDYINLTGTKDLKINKFSVKMDGLMKLTPSQPGRKVSALQESYTTIGTRLFLMRMKMMGLSILGLHDYNSKDAIMKIKILDLFTVVNQGGKEMLRAETVTYFNDLCIFAPARLADENIIWTEIDEHTVKGKFSKHNQTVSALLKFNAQGLLVDFISDDRLYYEDGNYVPYTWSTPLEAYTNFGDYYLPSKGKALWHMDDKKFDYLHLNIKSITYNKKSK